MTPVIDKLSVMDVPYWGTIVIAGITCHVSPELLAAQLWVESRFNAHAVGAAGERGIAQFMPTTWGDWGEGDPFDPVEGIWAQAHYLYWLHGYMISHYRPSPRWMLAAYNAGPGRCVEVASYGLLPKSTRDYVEQIITVYLQYTVYDRRNYNDTCK